MQRPSACYFLVTDAAPVCRGTDRSLPVQFLVSRLMSGSYVALREAGSVPTEEQPLAARAAAADGAAADAATAGVLHSEEQARA